MTTVINLDDLTSEPKVVIKIGTAEHAMKPLSVQDLIDNLKLVEEMGMNPGIPAEIEAGIKIITRAFPTLTEEQIRALPVEVLMQLVAIARGGDGEVMEGPEGNGKAAS